MTIQCKYCNFCKQKGRQQTQQNRQGRKRYYCEQPKVRTMKDRGLPLNNFVGFGTMTEESPLALKTKKSWCPLAERQGI